ncbi:unnamed protein product [Symbiodinium natans]|uniref:VOC domain-containing protein n=1 Tax=Symbiodinium natans TaxID=878477 RepID=A0A812KQ78_9DINO|nr:unnamed protein product [Symbiodinium natans]
MAFNAIGLVTGDKAVTQKIFSEGLGMSFQEFGKGDHLETTTASGVRIMLDTLELMRQINPDYKFAPEACMVHLGFNCSKPSEVDDICNKLKAAGATLEKEPWDAFWGQRYATLREPASGVFLDLFAALPEDADAKKPKT